jgi:hypothetical protein
MNDTLDNSPNTERLNGTIGVSGESNKRKPDGGALEQHDSYLTLYMTRSNSVGDSF